MISQRVLSEDDLLSMLIKKGCEPTEHRTNTGTAWKTQDGKHFIVPFALEGHYPDWMLYELDDLLGNLIRY